MSTRALSMLCLLLLVIGWVGAVLALVPRLRTEATTRHVDIVIDYNEMVALAGIEGLPLRDVFHRMQQEQVTGVALQEETLADLVQTGSVIMRPLPVAGQTRLFQLEPQTPEVFTLLTSGLARIYQPDSYRIDGQRIEIQGDPDVLRDMGLGLAPWKAAAITEAGLRVVPRLRGGMAVSARSLHASLAAVASIIGAGDGETRGIVVFDGLKLPGYRTLILQLHHELVANRLAYGSVEFGKQSGDLELGKALNGRLVRVHSISPAELDELRPEEAVQRFGLAVKDRNIRMIYVHQPMLTNERPNAGAQAHAKLDSAAEYLAMIRAELDAQGFTPALARPVQPFTDLRVPAWTLLLIFIGGGAGAMLWLLSILPVTLPAGQVRFFTLLMGAGLALAGVCSFLYPDLGRVFFGLLAAGGYPLLALTYAYRKIDRLPGERGHPFLQAVGALLIATAITLSGALLISAMLSETRYLVKVGQFVGVKVAMLVPLLLLLWLIITDGVARPGEAYADFVTRCRERLLGFLRQPIFVWGIAATMVALAALAILLARSGNEGMDVSKFELQTRMVLERIFVARPRTKEFLFGVPMFIFAMIAGARGSRLAALFFLFGAAIGQVDIFNTYCHAHTPLLLSLLRTAHGLWLGTLISLIGLFLFARHTLKRATAAAPERELEAQG